MTARTKKFMPRFALLIGGLVVNVVGVVGQQPALLILSVLMFGGYYAWKYSDPI